MKKIIYLLLIIFLLSASGAYSAEKMVIVVFKLKAKGVSDITAGTVSNMLRTAFVNTDRFTVVERSQMDAILEEQGFQQTGCTDEDCAVKLGRLMSARKILIGEVSKLGRAIVMNVRIVDVERGVVEYATMDKARNESALDSAVSRITVSLSSKIEDKDVEEAVRQGKIKGVFPMIKGAFLMPSGDLADMMGTGYGALLNLTFRDVLLRNFDMGIETGYLLFTGEHEKADKMTMIPAFASVKYRVNITGPLSFSPVISAGYSYNSITYESYDFDISLGHNVREKRTESAFEPCAKGGLILSYLIGQSYNLSLGAEYGSIFESDGRMDFLTFTAGFGVRL